MPYRSPTGALQELFRSSAVATCLQGRRVKNKGPSERFLRGTKKQIVVGMVLVVLRVGLAILGTVLAVLRVVPGILWMVVVVLEMVLVVLGMVLICSV